MRILETRNLGMSRLQIAEQSAVGWTVTMFPPDGGAPVMLQSEDPSGLKILIEQAQAEAAEYEGVAKLGLNS